jgi:hypothetical protein
LRRNYEKSEPDSQMVPGFLDGHWVCNLKRSEKKVRSREYEVRDWNPVPSPHFMQCVELYCNSFFLQGVKALFLTKYKL